MLNLKYLHFTIVYVLFISVLSHIPNTNIPESSPSFTHQDKLFHLTEFFFLGILIQLSFIERKIFSKRAIMFMTLICGFSMACVDELHQSFIDGRHSSIGDLTSDFLGIIFSVISYRNFY